MTTKAAENLYLAQHLVEWEGKGYAVHNPHGKPVSELPVIYGFNNGGGPYFLDALAISEDGAVLGSHACSAEGYMPHDLGVIEGSRPDRHKDSYRPHYPHGYRMDFVPLADVPDHEGIALATQRHIAKRKEAGE